MIRGLQRRFRGEDRGFEDSNITFEGKAEHKIEADKGSKAAEDPPPECLRYEK